MNFLLDKDGVEAVSMNFKVSNVKLTDAKQAGPDEYIYMFHDNSGSKYVLWARDYMDDLASEKVSVKDACSLNVIEWIETKYADDYDSYDDKRRHYSDGFWYALGVCK